MRATQISSVTTMLTAQQKADYATHGFLVLENFIKPDICELLMRQAHHLIEQYEPQATKSIFSTLDQKHAKLQYFLDSGDKIRFFFEEAAIDGNGKLKSDKFNSINKIGHALHDLDPVFYLFSRMNKIAALAKELNLINPYIIQSMYICKQAYFGGEVTCHQDATYLYSTPNPVVGFWFALEDATLENGCLWAIPGGHHTPVKSRMLRANLETRIETYDTSEWDITNAKPLEVPRGSVIILHGQVPHMSKENHSARSRHAYTLHLMSEENTFAKENWLQSPAFSRL